MEWLFVTKYRNDYTAEQLETYISSKLPGKNIICTQLKNNWGVYNSFKVGVEAEAKEKLFDEDFWPNGIEVSSYLFRNYKNSRYAGQQNISRPRRNYNGRSYR